MNEILVKYKRPTLCSFLTWIRNHPQSGHPLDEERFYTFVKNICKFNAKKWRNPNFVEKQIKKELPKCDQTWLEERISLFEKLIEFHDTPPYNTGGTFEKSLHVLKNGNYIERGVKYGKFYEQERRYSR